MTRTKTIAILVFVQYPTFEFSEKVIAVMQNKSTIATFNSRVHLNQFCSKMRLVGSNLFSRLYTSHQRINCGESGICKRSCRNVFPLQVVGNDLKEWLPFVDLGINIRIQNGKRERIRENVNLSSAPQKKELKWNESGHVSRQEIRKECVNFARWIFVLVFWSQTVW